MTTGAGPSPDASASNATGAKGKRKRVSFAEDTTPTRPSTTHPPQRQSPGINASTGNQTAGTRSPGAGFVVEQMAIPLAPIGTVPERTIPEQALGGFSQTPMQTCDATAMRNNQPTRGDSPDRAFDNLGNWSMFLRDSSDEAKLAQYFGLERKCDLRHFALSWPVIKTWIRAPHEQTSALKDEINLLVQNSKDVLSCVEDPCNVWPQQPLETVAAASSRRTHIMAWHLVQMSKDTEEYMRSSDAQNSHRTRKSRGEIGVILEVDLPLDDIRHPRPRLTTWRNELNDRLDRCWAILGYVSWIPYLMSWQKVLQHTVSVTTNTSLYDVRMPTSTKPRPGHVALYPQTSSLQEQTTTPVPSPIKIYWHINNNTSEKPDLCRIITELVNDGNVLPPTDQIMTQHPRHCKSGASFRDTIRRMMGCGTYGLNLCDLILSYRSTIEDAYYEINIFRMQWKVLKGIFIDLDNSDFLIRVLLDVHDFQHGDIYETTELPPVK